MIKVLCPACEGPGCEMCDYSGLVDESVANEIHETGRVTVDLQKINLVVGWRLSNL
jgi:hypothetical protein